MGPVVPHGHVSGEGIAAGLHDGAEEGEGSEGGRGGVEGGTDLLVHRR